MRSSLHRACLRRQIMSSLAVTSSLATANLVRANDVFWNNSGVGPYSVASNWYDFQNFTDHVPASTDVAHFIIAPAGTWVGPYLDNNYTTAGIIASDYDIRIFLNEHSWTLANSAADPLVVGVNSPDNASLQFYDNSGTPNGNVYISAPSANYIPVIGLNKGATGTLAIGSGATVYTNGANSGIYANMDDGAAGNGTLNIEGGELLVGLLTAGSSSGGTGTINISSGILDTQGIERIGGGGDGSVVQTGGFNQVGLTPPQTSEQQFLDIGDGGTGTYNLQEGTLSAPAEYIGNGGTGTFTQTDSVNYAEQGMTVGLYGTGTYNLMGGNLNVGADGGNDTIGSSDGNGTFTQTGGTANITGGEFVGYGSLGVGTENVSAGTHNVENLSLGWDATSSGTLNLSGTASLLAGESETIGTSGYGMVVQTGGENSINSLDNSSFVLADFSKSTGIYNMSGDSSTLYINGGDEEIGLRGSGTFTQTDGSNTIDGGFDLEIGAGSGSTGTYNLGGTGALSLLDPGSGVYVGGEKHGFGGNGTLNVSGGTLNTPTLQVFSTGTVMQNGGSITAGVTMNDYSITQTVGTAVLGAVTGIGSLYIGAASGYSASTTASGISQSSVNIYSTGLLVLNGGTSNTLNSLTISGNGQLDLTNHHLFINYSGGSDPVSTIRGYLATGYNGGHWNGPGIESSVAASNSKYALGLGDGAFGIVNGLSSGQIEIAYTLYGDINLDGVVNGTDFGLLALHFGKTVTGGWEQGDLNYDGAVTGADFALLAENFGKTASGAAIALPQTEWLALDTFAAQHGLLADVPEPTTLTTLFLIPAFYLARRRRS